MKDRVGILWRDELAAAIHLHLDEIDAIEILIDNYLEADRSRMDAFRALGRQLPLHFHSTGLGPASVERLDERRLGRVARFLDRVAADGWSEHLALVRSAGVEVGHLAPPIRSERVLEGLARNVERAQQVTGLLPALENIAAVARAPGPDVPEVAWTRSCIQGTGSDLLLDLHNLFTNATNFGFDAREALGQLPLERVREVHIAGGRWVGSPGQTRRLDDHRARVPEPVFELLEQLAGLCPQSLTVIVERDANFPPWAELAKELSRARESLAVGRASSPVSARERGPRGPWGHTTPLSELHEPAASPLMEEAELVRLYTDENHLEHWLAQHPGADAVGLRLAASGFLAKRSHRQ